MTKVITCCMLMALVCAFVPSKAFSDADILNFALNLECLEAEYYSWAAFGKGLTEQQRGGGPPSVGGMKAKLGDYQGAAEEIAMEEIAHVDYLRSALGDKAVACPKIDIGPAFAAAADAALATKLSPPFSPYANFVKFLHGALLFEDVGVMAYNGALSVLKADAYQAAARSIMAVEAYHAGIVRSLLSEVVDVTVEPYGVPVSVIVKAISTTLDALLGLPRNQPIGPLNGTPNLTPTDKNSLAYAVNPDAVLNVVYLSTTASMGGFFPNGINGLLGETRGILTPACSGEKVGRYKQCGGKNYNGSTCCEDYNTCVMTNEYYSACMPAMLPEDLVPWYGQCGGTGYSGVTKCEPHSMCMVQNEFYSQCIPKEEK